MPSFVKYDLNVILDPSLSEQQVQVEKDAVALQVERAGGEILDLEEWGLRRLAYPIRKGNEGYYLIYRLHLTGETPKTIETALRQRDNVMRVLVVRERPEWKTKKEPKTEGTAEAAA
ncbi:MAG: 30S ribosomal protein S6 [Deinococcales bacterium]|nr:30S ribosomal protein S6 [Deinococcales bacterium]